MNTTPYPFQLATLRKIDRFGGRALIAHSMGLGKSFTALLWAYNHPTVRPIVIVCPATVKWQWESQAKTHLGMRSEVLEGRKALGYRMMDQNQIFILNYDILGAWLPFLQTHKPQLVILDESQAISNPGTIRCKAARRLCKDVPHILCLSGTPMLNRPAELWPALNILQPKIFPSFWPWAMLFCAPRKTLWGWDFRGASNLSALHSHLKQCVMSRRLKKDVLKQLPPKTRSIIPLPLENPKEYTKAVVNFSDWMREKHKDKMHKALKAEALVKVGYLKRLAAELKLPAAIKWIDEFLEEGEGKIIIFAVHRVILDALQARYKKICTIIHGGVTGRHRQQAIEEFTKNAKTRIMLGNIKAAGSGWNGQIASTVCFVELDWTPGAHAQAEDRCHRIGTVNPVQAVYLVAKDTVEESLCRLIQKKQATLNAVLDGGEGDTLNIFDQLMQELKEGPNETRKGKNLAPRQARQRAPR